MKSLKLLLSLVAVMGLMAFAKRPVTGSDVVKMMYNRYAGKWHRALTFMQKTEMYHNDSLKRTQTWHEAMLAPDKLRIDIEPAENGNTIIFRGDSTYSIRNGTLRAAQKEENDLIFLLGGLYFYPYAQSAAKLKSLGYNLDKMYEDTWRGKPVYVIGVSGKTDNGNQLWVDKKDLYLVRMIKTEKQPKEECVFEGHVKIGGGWTETRASFYFNDKLVQVETYYNYEAPANIDDGLFDPAHYQKLTEKN